jgi:hypothetical protein
MKCLSMEHKDGNKLKLGYQKIRHHSIMLLVLEGGLPKGKVGTVSKMPL